MFTGIVQGLVPLLSIERESGLARFTLLLEGVSDGLELGASVAVNGTCLTVTRVEEHQVRFDVIAETLRMTNLGDLTEGDQVNVERSFRVGDEVGGHIVSGHVTGTAALLERRVFLAWVPIRSSKPNSMINAASIRKNSTNNSHS